MKHIFEYGRYSYEYYIEFSDRKTLGLEVLPDLRIIVKVPQGASLKEIEGFLVRKWSWLEKQLSELRKLKKVISEKQYVSGESFYYLGRQYMLLVETANEDAIKLTKGKLHIYTTKAIRNSSYNQKLLETWYERRRLKIFKHEYIKALRLFNFDAIPQLGQRVMSRRWGSYTADNKVLLNPRLIEVPREAIYYVCVHELCHVTNKRHDKLFYSEMTKRIPNWQHIKDSLEIRFG